MSALPKTDIVPADSGTKVMSILQAAVTNGATPESLEKIVGLQERIMAKQAEMDFSAAIHMFQSECPPIPKNKTAKAGSYSYEYASLDHIARIIAPIIRKCGLSYSFEASSTNEMVEATCTVRHIGGYSTSARFAAPVDRGAKMNDMQKQASALSYARRYALILALGLTTGEADDDGSSIAEFITPEQAADISSALDDVGGDKAGFLRFVGAESFERIQARDFQKCINAIEQKRRSKK